ncbi:MAG: HIT family protein [Actinomycetota bacterium]|nr:HIT family protein [Actinomycetota bacterium]
MSTRIDTPRPPHAVLPTCAFCQIVAGELPAHLVLRSPGACAFLDKRPLFPGHCLVVPPDHHETLLDLPEPEVGPLFTEVRRVAAAVTEAMGAAGTLVAINNRVSQSVAHLHVHVVPRKPRDGLRGFFWPRVRYEDDAEAADVAERIRSALEPRR